METLQGMNFIFIFDISHYFGMSSKKFIVAILSLHLDDIRAISSRKIALTTQTVPFNGMFIIYATYKTYKR